jgi:hypothetical protein
VRGAVLAFTLLLAAWPSAARAQPSCFTSPLPNVAPVKSGNPEPACQVLAKILETAGAADTAWLPGQIANAALKLTEGGFAKDTFVVEFRVTPDFSAAFTSGADELVRLSSTDASARTGSWWVPKEFVTDATGRWLSVAAIAELLALPPQANLQIVAYSGAIVTGTLGYAGIAAPAFNHRGGGVQFWFPSEPVYTKDVSNPTGTAR